MKFEKFEADFVTENRKLKLMLVICVVVFALGSIVNASERKYFLYQGKAVFEERPLAVEVCRIGFLSLVEGDPNPFTITEQIISIVKKDPFKIAIEKILVVKSLDENRCKIILKSHGRLLAFEATLEGKDSNPFYYKLAQLDEVGAPKEEP